MAILIPIMLFLIIEFIIVHECFLEEDINAFTIANLIFCTFIGFMIANIGLKLSCGIIILSAFTLLAIDLIIMGIKAIIRSMEWLNNKIYKFK